jgi:orotate phosphoribosyltransferase
MKNYESKVAEYLLEIKAVKLSPSEPFTWASGWKSPIYCDNRKTLSFPEVRNYIRDSFSALVQETFPGVEVIAGVATGAIAHGVLVAEKMNKPFVYVRSEAKKHGLENLVEGVVLPGQKVVVVEDLISTGGSSLKAVNALREQGCEVLGMVAIFTYGFPVAAEAFEKAGCTLHTLSNYNALTEYAVSKGLVGASELNTLKEWRLSPGTWGV